MVALTQNTFNSVKLKFYKQVMNLPVIVGIITEVITPAANDEYQALLRVRKESFTEVKCKCLYTREIGFKERQKYGLSNEITSMIYIPPDELAAKLGTFTPNHKKLIFRFIDYDKNALYEANQVVYMEPLYGSCISVRYHLKSTTKQIDVNSLTEAEKIIV